LNFRGYDLGADLEEEEAMDANPHLKRERAFLELMKIQDHELAEKLLSGTDDADGDESSTSYVQLMLNSYEVLCCFLGPVDVNCRNDVDGQTALHIAAFNNDKDGINLLLRYGADKMTQNSSGQTALDLARRYNSINVIALLS
jgi:ankyrin repeat protein